jgi:hypothetical protein
MGLSGVDQGEFRSRQWVAQTLNRDRLERTAPIPTRSGRTRLRSHTVETLRGLAEGDSARGMTIVARNERGEDDR